MALRCVSGDGKSRDNFVEKLCVLSSNKVSGQIEAGMKLSQLWDFLFGALLIGGGPWIIFGLTVIHCELFESLTHMVIPKGVQEVISDCMGIAAVLSFVCAFWFRLHNRKLPVGFLIRETLFGIAGAVLFLGLYGVVTYSGM